jgi:hypothetical protein
MSGDPLPPMQPGSMEAASHHAAAGSARGDALLLHHCLGIGGEPRPPARERLERALGDDLARLLVGALAPRVQGLRGSSSP